MKIVNCVKLKKKEELKEEVKREEKKRKKVRRQERGNRKETKRDRQGCDSVFLVCAFLHLCVR